MKDISTRSQIIPQNYINVPSLQIGYSNIISLSSVLLRFVFISVFHYFNCLLLLLTFFTNHVHLLHDLIKDKN